MASLVAACEAYRKFCVDMKSISVAVADFDSNFGRARAFYEEDPVGRSTLVKLCDTKGYPHAEVAWWLWGMEFYFMIMEKIWEGDKRAPWTAYDLTLGTHHTPALRFASKAFARALPNSKALYLTNTY